MVDTGLEMQHGGFRQSNPQNPFANQNGGNYGGNRGGSARGRGGSGGSRRNKSKCETCLQGNIGFCVHCLRCGADDHKANICPLKNGDASMNGGGNGQGGGNLNGDGVSPGNS